MLQSILSLGSSFEVTCGLLITNIGMMGDSTAGCQPGPTTKNLPRKPLAYIGMMGD
jgi:hypothetical protein